MLRTVLTSFPFLRRCSLACLTDSHYALGVTLLFLAVSGFTAVHHEMWRDEIQAWLIARDSVSVVELYAHLKYEGHPGLWYLFLMPLSRVSASPVVMQAFHVLIAGGTVYLFVRYAPFTRLQKFLFSFGYFPLYEYAVIARNYALGLLLITLLCVLFKERYQRPLGIGCVLFLLAHTSLYGLVVTVAVGGVLFCEFLWFRARGAALQTPPTRKKEKKAERDVHPTVDRSRRVWLGFALIGLGIVTAGAPLIPPSDSGYYERNARFGLGHWNAAMNNIFLAFFPIPPASLHFWNHHQWEAHPLFQAIQLPLSYVLLLSGVLLTRKRPIALLIYLASMLGLLTFFHTVYLNNALRHGGFLFVTFLMAAWMYREQPLKSASTGFTAWPRTFDATLTFILICQCIGGVSAVRMDLRHVFSFGKQTAEYIKAHGLQALPMVGDDDFAVSTVVGYLQKDHVYYPRGNRVASFIRWDQARISSHAGVVDVARKLRTETSEDVLIILNYPVDVTLLERFRLTSLAHFTGGVVEDEDFHLYLMR